VEDIRKCEEKLERMVAQNPLRNGFLQEYSEISRLQPRKDAEHRGTFARLVNFMSGLER